MAAASPQFEVYENSEGWQWRLRAVNGDIVAQGNQGYSSRREAINAQEVVARLLDGAVVEDV